MVIAANLMGMNAHRSMKSNSSNMMSAAERLSSGYRINRAGDDAAGLAISEKMRNQIHGLNKASRNAHDGISLIQTADGAMAEGQEMLGRIRELAIQSANDTNVQNDRFKMQHEVDMLLVELNAIVERAEFNTIKVLKGSGGGTVGSMPNWVNMTSNNGLLVNDPGTFTISVPAAPPVAPGADPGTAYDIVNGAYGLVDFSALTPANVGDLVGNGFFHTCCTCDMKYSIRFTKGTDTSTELVDGYDKIINVGVEGVANGKELVERVMKSTNFFTHYTEIGWLGSKDNISSTLVVYDNRNNQKAGLYAGSGVFEPGVWVGSAGLAKDLVFKTGANTGEENILRISLPAFDKTVADLYQTVSVTSRQYAAASLPFIDSAIERINSDRARMGAYQNRLEHTVKNVDISSENLSASESRIRDTDMAKSMMDYTKAQILDSAGLSMLAQANSRQEQVLQLVSQ